LTAKSLDAVAALFTGMAALTATRVAETDDQFATKIEETTQQFELASNLLTEALHLVVKNVRYQRSHWDEEFDRRVRESGYRGSLFILQEWRIHLETLKAHLAPILSGFKETCESASVKGWGESRREAEQHDPVLGSLTRPLCRAVIAFADFEEKTAQTAIVYNVYERTLYGNAED
jgi:hypothetical protein